MRWLLRRLGICPNVYYNFRKHRKADYNAQKAEVLGGTAEICHEYKGTSGYRSMACHLGSQYTSKAFVEFCGSVHVTQSMSKAGYPYDNAPMERYFNTLKNECTNLYDFAAEELLYQTVEGFAYVTYNHVRPHSYNGYCTPYEARIAS